MRSINEQDDNTIIEEGKRSTTSKKKKVIKVKKVKTTRLAPAPQDDPDRTNFNNDLSSINPVTELRPASEALGEDG